MDVHPSQPITQAFVDGFEPFETYLAINRNLSVHTQRAYRRDIAEFLQWLQDSCQNELQNGLRGGLNNEPAMDKKTYLRELPGRYVANLSGKNFSRTTLARKTSALKTFFKYLMKERYFEDGALSLTFHRPKLPRRLPEFLTPDEVRQLLASLDAAEDSPLTRRNRAIIQLLFSSGLRVGELAALDFGSVNWEDGELRILGKGGRERVGFMSQQALSALYQYREAWPMLAGEGESVSPESPLFLNRDGSRLNVRSVRRMLVSLGQSAGLGKALHPHLFRHSFATYLLNQGVDLRVVQELLGHVSIRSTQIYTHVTTERLRRAYLKAHPRAQEG